MKLKAIEKFLLNEEKKISFSKLGSWLMVLAGATLSILTGPAWLIIVCKYILAIGGGTAAAGIRDVIGQKLGQQNSNTIPNQQ